MIEMDDEGCDAKFKLLFDFIHQSKMNFLITIKEAQRQRVIPHGQEIVGSNPASFYSYNVKNYIA